MKRIELAFRQRPVQPSELDRDIVEPPRCEATIEMPHPWNDHPGDRNVDVGARLIEDENRGLLAWRLACRPPPVRACRDGRMSELKPDWAAGPPFGVK